MSPHQQAHIRQIYTYEPTRSYFDDGGTPINFNQLLPLHLVGLSEAKCSPTVMETCIMRLPSSRLSPFQGEAAKMFGNLALPTPTYSKEYSLLTSHLC